MSEFQYQNDSEHLEMEDADMHRLIEEKNSLYDELHEYTGHDFLHEDISELESYLGSISYTDERSSSIREFIVSILEVISHQQQRINKDDIPNSEQKSYTTLLSEETQRLGTILDQVKTSRYS